MPACQINNRKPAKTKPHRSGEVVAFVIGAAMDDALRHQLDVGSLDGCRTSKIKLSADSAHGLSVGRSASPQSFERMSNQSGSSSKLSIGLKVRMLFMIARSLSICSLRWKTINSRETGRFSLRTIADI